MVSVCVLVVGLSCPSEVTRPTSQAPPNGDGAVSKASRPRIAEGDELVVFFTGNELGSLRPCGCSGGQLGGIEKRSAVFDTAAADCRLIVETGSLVPGDREQDLMKFRVLFEAYRLLHYDVVHLTDRDREIAARLGLLAGSKPSFQTLYGAEKGRSAVFTRRMMLGGRPVIVNIVSFESPVAVMSPPAFALAPQEAPTVNILILDYADSGSLVGGYPRELLYRSWRSPGVECVVCPPGSDEPQFLSKPGEEPLVCTVGRFGRHIARLRVKLSPEDFKLQTSNLQLHFDSIPLQAKLPDDPALVQLYRQYQQLVAQSTLLEDYPRVPLPDGLAFAGSMSCKRCHESAYDKWSTTAHAQALASLKNVGSDRDPECVICHVSGLEYEGGFMTGEKTPHLAGVGCENCHGPGSAHVLSSGQTPTGRPRTACEKCHTPEHSGGFAGHEEEYMKKIQHWTEPNAVGSVK